MKLAAERTAGPNDRLLIVSRDLTRCAPATGIATTMRDALDRWDAVCGELHDLFSGLNAGTARAAMPFVPLQMAAPLLGACNGSTDRPIHHTAS